MKRKDFLKAGMLGGTIAGLGLGTTACKPEKKEPSEKPGNFELDEITADELQNAMKSGRYTSEKITQMISIVLTILKKWPHAQHRYTDESGCFRNCPSA